MVTVDRAERIFRARVSNGAAASPETVGQAREEARREASDWVNSLVRRYAAHLEKHEAECRKAKEKVLAAGGLHVLGTERHESRRVDNQLRGRAGRQGDPGSSQFFLSLDDDLMRIFAGDRLKGMMERLGMEDDVPIEAKMVTRSIENAQKRVEGHNFDIRKNLIEYDDVMNLQRKAIYALRRRVLGDEPMKDDVLDMIERVVGVLCQDSCPPRSSPTEWDLETLRRRAKGVFGFEPSIPSDIGRYSDLEMAAYEAVERRFGEKQESLAGEFVVVKRGLIAKEDLQVTDTQVEPVWRYLLRQFYLGQIDRHWRDHLTQIDHLREGIGLRGYGSRDPKLEYKREAHQLFLSMTREVDFNVCAELFNVQLMSPDEVRAQQERQRRAAETMQRLAEARPPAWRTSPTRSVRPLRPERPARAPSAWWKGRPRYRKTSKKDRKSGRS
ncbi:MAG: hypothetical protein HC923_02045 [Myxococcales bacterium]|nr:hypothetical protein [Myxococcales bacterium]